MEKFLGETVSKACLCLLTVGCAWLLLTDVVLFPPYLVAQKISPQMLDEQAGAALDAGDNERAVQLYSALVPLVPERMDVRINLGVALSHVGRYQEAEDSYQKVLTREPYNHTAQLYMGMALYKQGKYDPARNYFLSVYQAAPKDIQGLYLLADCSLRLGRYREVIGLLEGSYVKDAEDPGMDYLLGNALIQDGQYDRGTPLIDHLMKSGNVAMADLLLGSAYYAAGKNQQAVDILRKALDANPGMEPAWTEYGLSLLKAEQVAEAQKAFQQALTLDANDYEANLHLGALLRHDGDYERAATYLKRAVQLRPDLPQSQFQIHALEANQGNLEAARAGFEKLIQQWPSFLEAHLQLAMLYSKLHMTEQSAVERKAVENLQDKERTDRLAGQKRP